MLKTAVESGGAEPVQATAVMRTSSPVPAVVTSFVQPGTAPAAEKRRSRGSVGRRERDRRRAASAARDRREAPHGPPRPGEGEGDDLPERGGEDRERRQDRQRVPVDRTGEAVQAMPSQARA